MQVKKTKKEGKYLLQGCYGTIPDFLERRKVRKKTSTHLGRDLHYELRKDAIIISFDGNIDRCRDILYLVIRGNSNAG